MSSKLFFAVLGGFWLVAIFATGLFLLDYGTPSGPCVSSIEAGHFIDGGFQRYEFKGAITFWPEADSITIIGVVTAGGVNQLLRRQLRLKKIGRNGKRIVFSVQSVHVDAGDQLDSPRLFSFNAGNLLYMSIKKLSANEYLYFIDDNWVLMCRTR